MSLDVARTRVKRKGWRRIVSVPLGMVLGVWASRLKWGQRLAILMTLALYPLFCLFSWLRVITRRLLGLKPAIVWAPTPILTITESSAIMRRLGYPSTTLVFTTYYIRQNFDLDLGKLIRRPAVGWWLPNALFLWSLLRFDVFHFFHDGGLWSGMKIMPQAKWLELPLLRLAGKRIIASAYGADVRVRANTEKWQPFNLCRECPEPGKYCICDAGAGARNAKYYRDWCNVVLAMGDMHDDLFDSRLDFTYWPIDTAGVSYVGAKAHPGPVRLAHSPNHRYFKGTRFIEDAVRSLREKGYDLELVLVEGVSNAEARRRYAEADVVVAQCVAGWLGYTEIEGMAAGKPVISYLRDPRYLAHAPGCPVISASPDTLESEIEKLLRDPRRREELGRRGREHVEAHWSYEALAPRYDALHREVWERNRLGPTLRTKWADFFVGESRYRVGAPLQGVTLGEWPVHSDPFLNLRRIESGVYGQPPFDDRGIPRMFYAGRYVEHPGVVSLHALNAFHARLVEPASEVHRERFLDDARWLRDRLERDAAGVGRWYYRFEAVGRRLRTPWVSCFSQSLGLSILLRAEQTAPGQGFGEAAAAAARLFQVPVADGGIVSREDGRVYLEEYPEDPPAHVLNGFITGMFGVHEAYRATGQAWLGELFAQCLETLTGRLDDYVTARGLRYDLGSEDVVAADYFYFIVQQLRALHRITGNRLFADRAGRWARNMYGQKLLLFLTGRAPL